jgi:hypothetical protein
MTNQQNRSSRERLIVIYSNGSPQLLDFPEAVPLTQPLIRPLPSKHGSGRTYVMYTGQGATAGLVRVTPRGHWYREEDAACRGCGTVLVGPAAGMARTDAILDQGGSCVHRATGQDIATALLGRQAVAL